MIVIIERDGRRYGYAEPIRSGNTREAYSQREGYREDELPSDMEQMLSDNQQRRRLQELEEATQEAILLDIQLRKRETEREAEAFRKGQRRAMIRRGVETAAAAVILLAAGAGVLWALAGELRGLYAAVPVLGIGAWMR